MQYEIIGEILLNATTINPYGTTFNQDVTITIGIVGDEHGLTISRGITISNIPFNLGEEIPDYITEQCEEWVAENYPNT